MSAGWLGLAFLLSSLVPLTESLAPGLDLARGSQAALALLPWLALAALPRARPGTRSPWRVALECSSFLLPPLFLGLGLDLARGAPVRALALAAGSAWLALCLWVWAAELGARTSLGRRIYGALWLVLQPGGAALALALGWAPRTGVGDEALGPWVALDPLVACHAWGRPGALAGLAGVELLLPIGAAALVLLCVSRSPHSGEGRPA